MLNFDLDPTLRAQFVGRRALITGGAGFIAGHLAEALVALGAEVTLVDAQPVAAWDVEDIWGGAVVRPHMLQFEVGAEPFRQFLAETPPFDYIFHLAARAYAAGSVQTPVLDFSVNLVATVDLLEQLRLLGSPSRLMFASSAAVYGNPARLPIDEADITIPVSPYGVSKLAAERYVAVYAKLYGLHADSLRLFSVYGPRQRKQVVYDMFANLQRSPAELVVLGDGTQMRDMLYVGDVVRAFVTVAARGNGDGCAYNVASGVGTSTAELAREIIAVQGAAAHIRFTGATRPGDPERWLGTCAPLAVLGGRPRYSLHAGLRATAAWFNASHVHAAREVGA